MPMPASGCGSPTRPTDVLASATSATLGLGHDGASPSVRIERGPREEWTTQVRIAEWEGPVGLLLSLIEARKLDVLTVPLGGLAEAYLEALATVEHDRMTSISAFVAIAGQLILIKSRAILPRPPALEASVTDDDEADPEAELRTRLLLYRAYRDAGAALQSLAIERLGLFHREPAAAAAAGLAGAATGPAAPPLPVSILVRALDGLVEILPEPAPPPEILPRTITLSQRAAIIRLALDGAPTVV